MAGMACVIASLAVLGRGSVPVRRCGARQLFSRGAFPRLIGGTWLNFVRGRGRGHGHRSRHRHAHWPKFVCTAAAGELGFYLWCHNRVEEDNTLVPEAELPLLDALERKTLFARVLRHVPAPGGAEGVRAFICSWFFDVPFSAISRKDVERWVAWGLFARPSQTLSTVERAELSGYVAQLAHAGGIEELPPAGVESLPCMLPTWMPYRMGQEVWYVPLLVYALVALGDLAAAAVLWWHGFARRSIGHGRLSYWVLEADDDASLAPPLVFVHGVGIGLLPYCWATLPMLLRLRRGSGVMIACLPYVSMLPAECMITRPPSGAQLADDIRTMVTQHARQNEPTAVFVGHSYGTCVLAQLLHRHPQLFAGLVCLDPMCFLLHHSHMTSNFLYSWHVQASGGPLTHVLRHEFLLNCLLRRYFHWYDNCIWLEDLSLAGLLNTFVVVGDGEKMIPCEEVVRYLSRAETPPELMVVRGAVHGDVVLKRAFAREVEEKLAIWLKALHARQASTADVRVPRQSTAAAL
eukprot:NODE_6856_length_1631_cov_6.857048.p1 GENE.NODE_6856_length_1631_cov_6.857048~~NODE_6856_length_1631_cov_6.857048.p1  ORF type:complete len:520 (+),score=79.59 NODE_6856_length_1631_cov_6.857048:69-1628(+)